MLWRTWNRLPPIHSTQREWHPAAVRIRFWGRRGQEDHRRRGVPRLRSNRVRYCECKNMKHRPSKISSSRSRPDQNNSQLAERSDRGGCRLSSAATALYSSRSHRRGRPVPRTVFIQRLECGLHHLFCCSKYYPPWRFIFWPKIRNVVVEVNELKVWYISDNIHGIILDYY